MNGGRVADDDDPAPPKRRRKMMNESLVVGLSFGFIGVSSLFAWNAVITCSEYWRARFCGSSMERSFEATFSVIYQCTSLVATVFAVKDVRREASSPTTRIVTYQTILAVVFGGFMLLALSPEAPRDTVFLPLTLVGVAVCGVVSQKMCSACYGIAALLPPGSVSSLMSGQAVGGLIPALILVAGELKGAAGDDDDDTCGVPKKVTENAVAYFASSAALYALSIAALRVLERTATYRRALSSDEHEEVRTTPLRDADVVVDEAPLLEASVEEIPLVAEALGLTRLIAVPASAIVVVFAVTLSTFPTLTALARPEGRGESDDDDGSLLGRLFVPLLFLVFNLGDFLGRLAAGSLNNCFSPRFILVAAVARVGFLPLIMLGTLHHASLSPQIDLLRTTTAPFVVMACFAASNGLLATLAMGAAGPLVGNHQRQLAGNIMSLFLTIGLSLGSLFSFAILAIADS